MAWPTAPSSTVVFRVGVLGSSDTQVGSFPEWTPMEGAQVVLRPSQKMVVFDGIVVPLKDIRGVIDENGYLKGLNGEDIRVMATDDDRLSVTGWYWTAEMNQGKISVRFSAPSGGTVNIADYFHTSKTSIQNTLDQIPGLIQVIGEATDLTMLASRQDTTESLANDAYAIAAEAKVMAQQAASGVGGILPGATVSATDPTVDDGVGKRTGAIWEVHRGGILISRYVWSGTQWLVVRFGKANFSDGSITSQHIESLSVDKLIADGAAFDNAVIDTLTSNSHFTNSLAAKRVFVGDPTNIWRDVTFSNDYSGWRSMGEEGLTRSGAGEQVGEYYEHTEFSAEPGESFVTDISAIGAISGEVQMFAQYKNAATGTWTYMGVMFSGKPGEDPTTRISPPVPEGANGVRLGLFLSSEVTASESVVINSIKVIRRTSAVMIEDGAITSDKLSTSALDFHEANGMILNATQLNAPQIYAPSKDEYPHVFMGEGDLGEPRFKVSRMDDDGIPYDSVRLGGTSDDEMMIYNAAGEPVAGFRADGTGMSSSFEVDDLVIGGEPLARHLEPLSSGLKSFWSGIEDFPRAGSSPLGLIQLRAPMVSGRVYRIMLDGYLAPDQKGDTAYLGMVAAWNNPNLTASSTVFRSISVPVPTSREHVRFETLFTATQNNVLDVLFIIKNLSSSARGVRFTTAGSLGYAYVEDLGYAPTDTGKLTNATGPTFGGDAPVVKSPPVTVTKTYTPAFIRSWRGGAIDTRHAYHGNYGGKQRYSIFGFPDAILSDTNGATIKKVELYLRNLHAYYYSGMTVRVGYSGLNKAPASPVTSGATTSFKWARGQSKWVTLPTSGFNRSITLGAGASTGHSEYGYFSNRAADIKIRVTYSK